MKKLDNILEYKICCAQVFKVTSQKLYGPYSITVLDMACCVIVEDLEIALDLITSKKYPIFPLFPSFVSITDATILQYNQYIVTEYYPFIFPSELARTELIDKAYNRLCNFYDSIDYPTNVKNKQKILNFNGNSR